MHNILLPALERVTVVVVISIIITAVLIALINILDGYSPWS